MSIPVALDTSILSDISATPSPLNETEDRKAINALLHLAHQGFVELGIALTGSLMELHKAGELKRQVLKSGLNGLLHVWPVVVTPAHHTEIEQRKACLKKIMQDRGGSDSEIFLASTLHSQYFLTIDYRYRRQFKQQENHIRERCGITAHVLTPSEFLTNYFKGETGSGLSS